jgi:hypothetical protein
MPWRRWSVRTSLTLATVVVMTVLCMVISALILTGAHADRTAERHRLNQNAGMRAGTLQATHQLPPVIDDHSIAALQVIDPTGRIASASPSMVGQPRMAWFAPPPGQRLGSWQTMCDVPGFGNACMLVSVQRAPRRDGNWMIYTAAPASPWLVSGRLLVSLLVASGLVVAVTAIGARRIVGRSLKPVEAIRAQLRKIASTRARPVQ